MFIVGAICAVASTKMQQHLPIRRWERIVNNDVTYRMTLLLGFAGIFLFWRSLLIEVSLPGALLLVLASLLSAFTFLVVYVPIFRRAGRRPSRAKGIQSELSDLIEGKRKN